MFSPSWSTILGNYIEKIISCFPLNKIAREFDLSLMLSLQYTHYKSEGISHLPLLFSTNVIQYMNLNILALIFLNASYIIISILKTLNNTLILSSVDGDCFKYQRNMNSIHIQWSYYFFFSSYFLGDKVPIKNKK